MELHSLFHLYIYRHLESSEGYLPYLVRMEKLPRLLVSSKVKFPHCPRVGEVDECVAFVTPRAAYFCEFYSLKY